MPRDRTDIDERIILEPHAGRVRAKFNGEVVADSTRAMILRERGYPPRIYFPPADARLDLMEPTSLSTHCPYKGDASYWTLKVGGESLDSGVWAYRSPLPGVANIAGYMSFADGVDLDPAPARP